MGKLEGIFIIAVALVLLWIGITGRGEALMEAIGTIRKAPKPAPKPVTMGGQIYSEPIGPMPLDTSTPSVA